MQRESNLGREPMFNGYWRRRAEKAEAEAAELREKLESLKTGLDGMALRFKERSALISIAQDGRMIRLGFVRNDQLYYYEFFSTWDNDLTEMQQTLLMPKGTGND